MEFIYCGLRELGAASVAVCRLPVGKKNRASILSPKESLKIRNHSPDGFEWGYSGSGPAQLALAIMLHYFTYSTDSSSTGEAIASAEEWYQMFKREHVAGWQEDAWKITTEQIREWMKS